MSEKNIGLFKLISGEEVISEFHTGDEKSPDYYLLRAPRRVFLAQVSANQLGIKMAPWIVGNPDGVFPIHSAHVLTVSADASPELKDGYAQQTSPIDLSQAAGASKIIV